MLTGDCHAMAEATPSAARRGCLYVHGGHALMVGCAVDNQPHAHYNASILVATGKPFLFRHDDAPWQESNGLCVAPCVPQQLRTQDDGVLIMQVDPDGRAYRGFGGRFAGRPVVPLSDGERLGILAGVPEDGWSGVEAMRFFMHVMQVLGRLPLPPLVRDRRVERVRRLLVARLEQPPPVQALAASVALSVSRLQHLFKQELGLPLSHYLLWRRVRDTVQRVQAGISLTEAALHAGFADSAHFSRTFRRMFGLPPSSLLKDSSTVQVEILPDDR